MKSVNNSSGKEEFSKKKLRKAEHEIRQKSVKINRGKISIVCKKILLDFKKELW